MTKRDITSRVVAAGIIGALSVGVGWLGIAAAANGGSATPRAAKPAAASKFAVQSYAQTGLDRNIVLTTKYGAMARTARLRAGTYYVSAAALMESGETGACVIGTTSTKPAAEGGSLGSGGLVQAAETAAIRVTSGGTITEYCRVVTNDGESRLSSASITAVRVLHSVKGTVHAS